MAVEPKADGGSARTALVKFAVTCPLCDTPSTQFRINPRLFWNKGQDIDLQPLGYQFIKGAEQFFPPHYYMWHCQNCHFTAGYKYFSDPLKGVLIGGEMVRAKVNEAFEKDVNFRMLVDKLGTDIQLDQLDFLMSIKIHLLAILYIDLFEDMVKQHFVNRARYYLRLAWLFRDLEADPVAKEKFAVPVRDLIESLRPYWPEIPLSERMALRKAVDCYSQSAEDAHVVKSVTDRVYLREVIARIWIKLTEYTEAQQILMSVGDEARKERTRIEDLLKSKAGIALPRDQRDELVSQSRRLATMSDESQKLVDSIRESVNVQQLEKAKILLKEAGKRPVAELRTLLADNRIGRRVIDELVPEEKRGLFGLRR